MKIALLALSLAVLFVAFSDGNAQLLTDGELLSVRGASLEMLRGDDDGPKWKLGECDYLAVTCTTGNPTPECGFTHNGVCVPVVSACKHGAGCANNNITASRCKGLIGQCWLALGVPPTACPGTYTWGQCVSLGATCKCDDTGAAHPDNCLSIQDEC